MQLDLHSIEMHITLPAGESIVQDVEIVQQQVVMRRILLRKQGTRRFSSKQLSDMSELGELQERTSDLSESLLDTSVKDIHGTELVGLSPIHSMLQV
jgi:hypothetical protein